MPVEQLHKIARNLPVGIVKEVFARLLFSEQQLITLFEQESSDHMPEEPTDDSRLYTVDDLVAGMSDAQKMDFFARLYAPDDTLDMR